MMTKPWTEYEEYILRRHAPSKTVSQLASVLHRSETAVRLKLHRMRIAPLGENTDNILVAILRKKFVDENLFHPNADFYERIGMSSVHFWRIYKGVETLTYKEALRVREVLKVEVDEFYDCQTGCLFDEEIIYK